MDVNVGCLPMQNIWSLEYQELRESLVFFSSTVSEQFPSRTRNAGGIYHKAIPTQLYLNPGSREKSWNGLQSSDYSLTCAKEPCSLLFDVLKNSF